MTRGERSAKARTHLSLDGDGSLECSVHSEDGALWRIDDRSSQQRSEDASVADSESAAVHVLNGECSVLGLDAKSIDTQLDLGVVHAFDVAQDGNDETFR